METLELRGMVGRQEELVENVQTHGKCGAVKDPGARDRRFRMMKRVI